MEMEKHRENFNANLKKCVENFESLFNTYDQKISFLKKAIENPHFIETIENGHLIKESINLLVQNAMVTETRKMQQAHMMPLIKLMFSNVPIEQFIKQMKDNPADLTSVCLLYIAFQFDPTMKDHANKHHVDILESLNKYVRGLTGLN